MKSFELLIRKFDSILKECNSINYKRLQDPLSENEIDSYFRFLELEDADFKALYGWKNGLDYSSVESLSLQIFDFGGLVSLEYIIKCRNIGIDYWEKNFFPIISSGDGDFMLFNNRKGSDYGKVHLFSPAVLLTEEPISYYDSIYAMIETTSEAYKKKIFKYDPRESWLNINFEKFNKMSMIYNPLSKFWKLR